MNTMSRMTLRHLELLYNRREQLMALDDDGNPEHTDASEEAERHLFAEAARISGRPLTGYSHGGHTLDQVFRAAAAAAGTPW